MAPRTLLSPFAKQSDAPAILLPASASPANVKLSYNDLGRFVDSVRQQLDEWDSKLQVGDVVSMSLINSAEFAAAFLGIGAHRSVAQSSESGR